MEAEQLRGAALDAEIDRVVFGNEIRCSHGINCSDIPPFSTDLDSAWLIVEEMSKRGWSFSLWSVTPFSSVLPGTVAAFEKSVHPPDLYEGDAVRRQGETPAQAICLAALAAAARA